MNNNQSIWDCAKSETPIGKAVWCVVDKHCPFGVLVTVERTGIWGVIERIGMAKDGYITPQEYPPIGSHIEAIIIGFRDYCQQVELRLPPKRET